MLARAAVNLCSSPPVVAHRWAGGSRNFPLGSCAGRHPHTETDTLGCCVCHRPARGVYVIWLGFGFWLPSSNSNRNTLWSLLSIFFFVVTFGRNNDFAFHGANGAQTWRADRLPLRAPPSLHSHSAAPITAVTITLCTTRCLSLYQPQKGFMRR